MYRVLLRIALLLLTTGAVCSAQNLSPKWEELTAGDFVKALDQSNHLCLLPFGILEKHGPSGPLGTDLIDVRYTTMLAVKQEYAIVFPEYYFGQISEARQQPGTIAYPRQIQLDLLQATVSEMARNGCSKILIVNGHGGNLAMLDYFIFNQLDSPKDYVVYTYSAQNMRGMGEELPAAARSSQPGVDGHAGEDEISTVMASRPDLAHPDRGKSESGENLARLKNLPPGVSTGIWWYARFPNHYEGDASGATAARGQALESLRAQKLIEVIRAVKQDQSAPQLQKEFFQKTTHPVDTKQ